MFFFAFDFDGTIANTMPMLERLALDVIRRHVFRTHPRHDALERGHLRQWYRETAGLPFKEQMSSLYLGRKLEGRIVSEFQEKKRSVLARAEPFPGATRALRHLDARGHRIGVVSSTERFLIVKFLDFHELPYDSASGIESGDKSDQLIALARRWCIQSGHLFFMGDSIERDAAFARRAGTQFITIGAMRALEHA